MKKRLVFLLVAVLTAGYAQAQVNFGARAGLNLSTWIGDGDVAKFKPGFQIGAVADIAFKGIFVFQPGLLFSQMGCQEKDDGDTYKINLNYIQIPLHVNTEVGGISLQAGPYLGFGLGTKTTIKTEGVEVSASSSFDEAGLKSFDFGFGVGINYPIGPIQAALNTQIGLARISDDFSKIRNWGLSLTATYFFGK